MQKIFSWRSGWRGGHCGEIRGGFGVGSGGLGRGSVEVCVRGNETLLCEVAEWETVDQMCHMHPGRGWIVVVRGVLLQGVG